MKCQILKKYCVLYYQRTNNAGDASASRLFINFAMTAIPMFAFYIWLARSCNCINYLVAMREAERWKMVLFFSISYVIHIIFDCVVKFEQ